jgi:very-short-patch-repair endonuclease
MTSLEQKVADVLSSIGFNVADDGLSNTWYPQYKIGRYRVDFAWPTPKILIEVDGDHWHGVGLLTARQLEQKEKDKRKAAVLNAKGWHIIRIKERDLAIDDFPQQLNEMILGFIEV